MICICLDARRRVLSGLGILLLIAAAIPGCVGGPGLGSFSFPDSAQISDVQFRALAPAGRARRWRITAQVTDPNNDVVGGTASVSIFRVNEHGSAANVSAPGFSMTILDRDLRGNRFSAILILDNAPAGEIAMGLGVEDAAGNPGFGGGSVVVTIPGRTAPGSATRPEELRGALVHG